MYTPTLARFQSRDPMSPNGVDLLYPPPVINPYIYAHNNPIKLIDPSGQVPQTEWDDGNGTCDVKKKPCKVTTLERKKGVKCPEGYTPYTAVVKAGALITSVEMCGKCEGGDDCKSPEKCTFEVYTEIKSDVTITTSRCRCAVKE